MHFKKTLSVLLCSSALINPFSALAEGKINKIIVEGNKRVESSTIKKYLPLKVGDKVSIKSEQDSIQTLYKTNLFENVKLKFDQGVLKVKVEETPLIVKVIFKGNSKIGSKNINKVISTKVGQSLKNRDLEHDLATILEMYKKSGRYSVLANYKVEKLKNNRVKVVFNITEGPKTSVKRIRFIGNKHYRDDHLRTVILTKESKWFRFLSSDDTYDPDRMEYDQMLLAQFYKSMGYADFKIISANAELAPTKDHFTLYYAFDEGPKYKFGEKSLSNNIYGVKDKYIMRQINIKKGKFYNASHVENIEQRIGEYLANKGYPAANVYHVLEKDEATRTINVKFIVDMSDKVYINKINIKGNLKTHDNVIRREFDIQEGDLFNRSHIEKGDRNLRMLNYFEKVQVKPVATAENGKYDMDIEVEEKSTTSIGLEGGYNSSIGPFASVNFQDRNLLGTGKYLDMGMRVAKRNTSYNFGVTNPYFMGRDLSLGTQLFYTHVGSGHSSQFFGEGSNYTMNTKGGKVSLGYALFEDMRHDVFYTIKHEELSVSQTQHSAFIREQEGKFTTSAVGHALTLNKLDNNYSPKSGFLLSASQEFAGVGGDNKYIKHELSGSKYTSFAENEITLKLSAETGQIRGFKKHKVRINDRFNLGDQSLRGFASRGIGPRDKRTLEALGGKNYYAGTAELQFPIGAPKEFGILGAAFMDIGGVYGIDVMKNSLYTKKDIKDDKAPRISYGFGFIWNTRMLPIKVYYSFRLRKGKMDEVQPFTFNMTTSF